MAEQSDRVVIKFGPGRLDADKSIQREIDTLREEIETKQTNVDLSDYPTTTEVEEIVIDVIGQYPPVQGGGFIVGLPPGTPFAFVSPVLQNGVINMSNTVLLDDNQYYNMHFFEDTNNHFGLGSSSVVGKLDDASGAAIFNFTSGTANSITHASTAISSYVPGPNFAVSSTLYGVTSLNNSVAVVSSGLINMVTLTPPVSGYTRRASGPSSDGNNICSVWTSPTSSITAVITLHDTSGNLLSQTSGLSLGSSTGFNFYIVNNGRVIIGSQNFIYAGFANTGALPILLTTAGPLGATACSSNVTSDGHIFYTRANRSLYRLNLNTGVVTVWPDVFRRPNPDPTVLSSVITPRSMYAISSSKLVFGGLYFDYTPPNITVYPIYSAAILTDSVANVSDTIFSPYLSNNGNEPGVYVITRKTDGTVVFGFGLDNPSGRYLVQVAGP